MEYTKFKSTTILGVRVGRKIALGGDGQVTMGDIKMKSKAVKVREFANGSVLAGFAGAAADAMSLFERFEGKLEETKTNLAYLQAQIKKTSNKESAMTWGLGFIKMFYMNPIMCIYLVIVVK